MQEPIPGVPLEQNPFGPLGRQLLAVCKAASVLGSAVFVLLVAMSIVSIVGRKLWSAPVPGDVELLQVCSAFAASSFFAYCHLNGGDVKVDFFTAHMRSAWVHRLDAGGSLLVGLVGALLAWRTTLGALGVRDAAETTMILDLPLWWGQIAMVPGFVLLALAGFYMVAWHLGQSRKHADVNTTSVEVQP